MNEDGRKSLAGVSEASALEEVNRLLRAFSNTSAIGFGICDSELRYRCINRALAVSHGIAAEAHLGHTVRDVLGEVAFAIEPASRHVLFTGEVVSKEISGKLPHREGTAHWLATYFPVNGNKGQAQVFGAMVIEITQLKELDSYFDNLTQELLRAHTADDSWFAGELHDSVTQYLATLKVILRRLTQHTWRCDQSADEQLTPIVHSLDQRILKMRSLVSAVAARFPIDRKC